MEELAKIKVRDSLFHAKCREADYFFHNGQFYKYVEHLDALYADREYKQVGDYILVKPDMIYTWKTFINLAIKHFLSIRDNYNEIALSNFGGYVYNCGVHYFLDKKEDITFVNGSASIRDLITSTTITEQAISTIERRVLPNIRRYREAHALLATL